MMSTTWRWTSTVMCSRLLTDNPFTKSDHHHLRMVLVHSFKRHGGCDSLQQFLTLREKRLRSTVINIQQGRKRRREEAVTQSAVQVQRNTVGKRKEANLQIQLLSYDYF